MSSTLPTLSRSWYITHASRDPAPAAGIELASYGRRNSGAALPDIPYVGICLTMPDVLWPIFQLNRHLLHDLPALGAAVIQQWVKVNIRVLLSRHRPKVSAKNDDLSDLVNRLAALEARELASIGITIIKAPGRTLYVTEELLRALGLQQDICFPNSH